ncbi:N-acetylmuramic acid 6-phosphate etherase [Alteromonas ponticola]|uniref:N-acetylmuramic acid 6-phosphate etherase n=1 Tax=Alteromonas aquimaris TaxID=2998417 RepID=A0ABT3P5G6_9ALTE|nr:N-acetylmuramic acid 6-phosphate etherase [Alteromonas aquimaris]MCW8108007.1 N-acetylmuramic acid 6-phosphate etherase [Alteromonas aquimaris]
MTNHPSEDLLEQLQTLTSEQRNAETTALDTLDTIDILAKINHQDALVAPAIAEQLPLIAQAVDAIVEGMQKGGRLIYVGAGTSGRLGILDAAECRPTFSVDDTLVVGVIAGGSQAVQHAVEGAEDNPTQGKQDLELLAVTVNDIVVGLSASGRTPYVIGALEYANATGAQSVSVSCNPRSPMTKIARISICPQVGPEVLTGSTRMKAGTAQKLILNMLSTTSMIKLGKTYQNLMVDVVASNQKLKARAVRIVMQATECNAAEAEHALSHAKQNAKQAILMILMNIDAAEAAALLDKNKGFLRKALNHES